MIGGKRPIVHMTRRKETAQKRPVKEYSLPIPLQVTVCPSDALIAQF